jgi:hypothetical protein
MTGDNSPPTNENQGNDPRRRLPRLDPNALILGLERLRECVEQRLKSLEMAARRHAATTPREPSQLERELHQRIAEHDEAQVRSRMQTERREHEWRVALEQLEGDRKLLADAWERLERERLEAIATAQTQGASRAPVLEHGAVVPVRAGPEAIDQGNDVLSQAVLKQFQALRNDVRRNARQLGPR